MDRPLQRDERAQLQLERAEWQDRAQVRALRIVELEAELRQLWRQVPGFEALQS